MLTVRPPESLADEVIRAADQAGMSINDYLVMTIAEKHNFLLPPVEPTNKDPNQEALPLGA